MNDKPMLAAQQLEVTLSGRTVLNGVSLSLPSRQLVALVGPNGAGKTTLLRALAGLVPSTGSIEIGGDRLSSLSLRERARRFGYLPQGHHGALAAAGQGCRRARALPAWRHRSGTAVAA